MAKIVRPKIICNSVEEFIKLVFGIHSINHPKISIILYRGQKDSTWELTPRVWRNWKDYLGTHTGDFSNYERRLFEEFKRFGSPLISEKANVKSEWDYIALAQHFGLPTRLIDWSDNPLIALWFAFEEDVSKSVNRTVWILLGNNNDIVEYYPQTSPFEQKKTRIFAPNYAFDRVTNQKGWFTVHYYSKPLKKMVPLENIKSYKTRVMKIEIPNSARTEILAQLDLLGINRYSLFPDLEGLSGHLSWKASQ